MKQIQYITVEGIDYVHIQSLAEALGVSTATVYNYRRAGQIEFSWPLGKVMTYVTREEAEKIFRQKVTDAMGAFARTMEK